MNLKNLTIGYDSYHPLFSAPGDKRRFVFYAKKRGISFEIAKFEKNYDLVILNPLSDFSVWRNYTRGFILLDMVDSYLEIPSHDIKNIFRGMAKYFSGKNRYLALNYRKSLLDMCVKAHGIVCATKQQQNRLNLYNSNVHIILDAQDYMVKRVKSNYGSHKPFKLVWEGLPQNVSTLRYLNPILTQINQETPLELNILTSPIIYRAMNRYFPKSMQSEINKLYSNTLFHLWDEETWSDIVNNCDLAIIPIPMKNAWMAGKSENKLLMFWRAGMPAVTSATPAYVNLMKSAGLNMCCSSPREWLKLLRKYIKDEKLRQSTGQIGRKYTQQYHSETSILKQWDDLLISVLKK